MHASWKLETQRFCTSPSKPRSGAWPPVSRWRKRQQQVYQPKDEEKLYLVLDRLEGGSVDALRKKEGRIEEGHAAYIIAQVVDAVRYCHSLNMAVSRGGKEQFRNSERRCACRA